MHEQPMSFGAALRALYEERITFTQFARETHLRWKRLAIYLRTRWKQPIWNGIEDVIQELLEGAWRCLPKFDPTRGVTLDRYVIFNAVDRAKKSCHRARGAKLSGSADRNPSNLEITFSTYDEETERFVMDLLQEPPTQHRYVERIEAIERARVHCRTMVEHLAIGSLARTQSVIVSADVLYSDYRTRLACRFNNEDQALRAVSQAIADVANRMQGEEAP
jgi:DNA-directed RNA polymerase specialized sigma24 family protein